jgi:hypothetical protein
MGFQIGQPWSGDLLPGSSGNVSAGGSFFKFSSDIIPYPVNSNNFFTLKGGRRRKKKSKTTRRRRIRRKTRRLRLIKTK